MKNMKIRWNRIVLLVLSISTLVGYGFLSSTTAAKTIPILNGSICWNEQCYQLWDTPCRIEGATSYWCGVSGGGGAGVKPL